MANLEDKVNEILGLETRQEKEETKATKGLVHNT